MIWTSLISILLLASTASAAQSAADKCATALAKDPRAIYDASAAEITPTTNLKALLTAKTRSLVEAGTVARTSARASARAAAKCLEMLQKTN